MINIYSKSKHTSKATSFPVNEMDISIQNNTDILYCRILYNFRVNIKIVTKGSICISIIVKGPMITYQCNLLINNFW